MSENVRKGMLTLIILFLASGCAEKQDEAVQATTVIVERPTAAIERPTASQPITSKSTASMPTASQVRTITALPLEVYADAITVQQFRRVCDAMARDLILQAFVTSTPDPPVITIRKIQNKTERELDEQIFQETIRVKLIENAKGAILFRDDESYHDIIEERARQSSGEVSVTLTDTTVKTDTIDRVKEREFDGGALSLSVGNVEGAVNIERKTENEITWNANVESKVTAADYFLRGIIYQVNERHSNIPEEGTTYFQYQFRVTDARTGLIVWEKMVSSKMEGTYQVPSLGDTANPENP